MEDGEEHATTPCVLHTFSFIWYSLQRIVYIFQQIIPTNQNVKQIKFIISAYVKCMIGEFFRQVY